MYFLSIQRSHFTNINIVLSIQVQRSLNAFISYLPRSSRCYNCPLQKLDLTNDKQYFFKECPFSREQFLRRKHCRRININKLTPIFFFHNVRIQRLTSKIYVNFMKLIFDVHTALASQISVRCSSVQLSLVFKSFP